MYSYSERNARKTDIVIKDKEIQINRKTCKKN